ncbi:MAG: microtubule-binding protein [Pseudobdellovibrio sp.]
MGLGYNKNSKHEQSESFWTSYSDLFLGLSSIFLMLYVVASLRTGTNGMQHQAENQKLKIEVQDLKNQLKTYESVKENYMQTSAPKSELDEYNELMDKLSLLQQESKDEKDKLTNQAKENESKEKALNKYQQMVRNVINSNKFSKVKINNRNEIITEKETVIGEKDVEIKEQDGKIANLNKDISSKQHQIALKENQIAQASQSLEQKMKELKNAYKHQKLTQKVYNNRLKKMKEVALAQIDDLNQQKSASLAQLKNAKQELGHLSGQLNQTQSKLAEKSKESENLQGKLVQTEAESKAKIQMAKQELGQVSGQLNQVSGQLNQVSGQLNQVSGRLAEKNKEAASLQEKLGQSTAETQAKIAQLKGEFESGRAKEREAFESALRNQKNLGAAEIARREGEFKKSADAKERKLAGELAGLSNQLKETEGELTKTRAELAARQGVAIDIKKGFDKAGIKADIDMKTGDVVIDFGQAYFDNDSSALKNEMRNVLQKAMPVYSKSLFGNKQVSSNISAVEVIGFASPTYQGRFIDPNSTKKADKEALKYNMDLSYRRARSIFNYILDEAEIKFQYQQNLIPLMKVSGRSFLESMKVDRKVATAEEFCKLNDCKKTQRVIIRFNMDKKN